MYLTKQQWWHCKVCFYFISKDESILFFFFFSTFNKNESMRVCNYSYKRFLGSMTYCYFQQSKDRIIYLFYFYKGNIIYKTNVWTIVLCNLKLNLQVYGSILSLWNAQAFIYCTPLCRRKIWNIFLTFYIHPINYVSQTDTQ